MTFYRRVVDWLDDDFGHDPYDTVCDNSSEFVNIANQAQYEQDYHASTFRNPVSVWSVIVPDVIQSLIKSRRFWAGVAAIAVPVLNEKFGWGLSEEGMTTMALAIVGWIVGESLRSSQDKPDVPAS